MDKEKATKERNENEIKSTDKIVLFIYLFIKIHLFN